MKWFYVKKGETTKLYNDPKCDDSKAKSEAQDDRITLIQGHLVREVPVWSTATRGSRLKLLI